NMPKLHELAKFLYEQETITGEEFMEILNRKPEKIEAAEEDEKPDAGRDFRAAAGTAGETDPEDDIQDVDVPDWLD
ncbi:MAG: hypothetical protein IJG17_04710, partial [Eubacterium sp.]|nr:hypothetical protein [Eubacterium sp.]